MRNYITYTILAFVFALSSCSDRKPTTVFMPDMYYPIAYDPYQESELAYSKYIDREGNEVPLFKNRQTALRPVKGTVPQNQDAILPYSIENDQAGYQESKAITSPLKETKEATLERGEMLYNINCAVCHGTGGDGKGSIVKTGAYAGVPNYKDREITVGSVYHVIMYGKNAMGSYASQIEEADRWRVAEYVIKLKNK
jgi:mono/diheme cytochrome c family protein